MEYNIVNIRDKIRMFEKTGKETSTFFMTPAQIQDSLCFLKGYDYTISGGYEEAERRIIIIGSKEANTEEYLTVINIESFGSELKHRNVLGSLLGLGIKREIVGDIIINEKNCSVIIIKDMKEYIMNNLRKIGNEKVSVKEVPFSKIALNKTKKESQTINVASLRVDALISSAYGLAREKSANLINQEKVLINFLPCNNNSKAIKEDDIISVRGFGRIKVLEKIRRNKKR